MREEMRAVQVILALENANVVIQVLQPVLVVVNEPLLRPYFLHEPDRRVIVPAQVPEGVDLTGSLHRKLRYPPFFPRLEQLLAVDRAGRVRLVCAYPDV